MSQSKPPLRKTPSTVFRLAGGNVETLNGINERGKQKVRELLQQHRKAGWIQCDDLEIESLAGRIGIFIRELMSDTVLETNEKVRQGIAESVVPNPSDPRRE